MRVLHRIRIDCQAKDVAGARVVDILAGQHFSVAGPTARRGEHIGMRRAINLRKPPATSTTRESIHKLLGAKSATERRDCKSTVVVHIAATRPASPRLRRRALNPTLILPDYSRSASGGIRTPNPWFRRSRPATEGIGMVDPISRARLHLRERSKPINSPTIPPILHVLEHFASDSVPNSVPPRERWSFGYRIATLPRDSGRCGLAATAVPPRSA